jgi:hypothetical protein
VWLTSSNCLLSLLLGSYRQLRDVSHMGFLDSVHVRLSPDRRAGAELKGAIRRRDMGRAKSAITILPNSNERQIRIKSFLRAGL